MYGYVQLIGYSPFFLLSLYLYIVAKIYINIYTPSIKEYSIDIYNDIKDIIIIQLQKFSK